MEENMEDVDSFMFLEAVESDFSEEESDFFAVKEEAEPLYVPDNEVAADVSVQEIVGTEDVVPANIDDTSLEEVKLSDLQDVWKKELFGEKTEKMVFIITNTMCKVVSFEPLYPVWESINTFLQTILYRRLQRLAKVGR